MAKSKIQFQKGYSLFEFLKDYGTEAQCENALFTWRFPNGFVCPECANKTCCRLRRRPRVWQCNHCRHQMSLTGNTIFANTKLPLTKWFLAMHLLSQTKTGSSRDPGKVEVDRQGAGKLVVAKHTTTITLLSPCIILILPPSGQVIP
ncbi:transposase, partial [Aeromonas caviae]